MNIGNLNTGWLVRAMLKVLVLSVIANVVLAYVGKMLSHPPATFGPYMLAPVVGFTVLGVVLAAVGYAIARSVIHDTEKANWYYIVVSVILLLASFYPDVMMPWSTDPDQVGWTYGIIANLILMHVVTFALVIHYFVRKRHA